MNATCAISPLLKTLQTAARLANRASRVNPILANCLAESVGGVLTLHGSDLETSVSIVVPDTTVDADGKFLIPTASVIGVLNGARSKTVTIEASTDRIHCSLSDSEFEFSTADAAQFPRPNHPAGEPKAKIMGAVLADLIDLASPCVSTNGWKGNNSLCGINVLAANGRLTLIGADGWKSAIAHGDAPFLQSLDAMGTISVPLKAAELMSLLCRESEDDVSLWINPLEVHLQTAKGMVATRLIEGKYPTIQKIVDGASAPKAKFSATVKDIRYAVGQASLVFDDYKRAEIKVDEEVAVSSKCSNGTASLLLPATGCSESAQAAIRADDFLAMLKPLDADRVVDVAICATLVIVRYENFTGCVSVLD